jgi:hypothetical protein
MNHCTSAHHQLVCRPNLDLHTGTTGIYRRRHGNLRRDGAQAVLERALGGEADSRAIHFDAGSVRYRWLDRLDARPTASWR